MVWKSKSSSDKSIIGRFGESLASDSKIPIKCVFLNNQPRETRPTMVFDKSI